MQRHSVLMHHRTSDHHTISTRPAITHSSQLVCRAKHKYSTVCHSILPAQTLGHLVLSSGSCHSQLDLSAVSNCAATTAPTTGVQLEIAAIMDSSGLVWPVALSLLAGLSTSIGGIIAVTLSPDEGTLAFLLGTGRPAVFARVALPD
jgi:hypothetical protein